MNVTIAEQRVKNSKGHINHDQLSSLDVEQNTESSFAEDLKKLVDSYSLTPDYILAHHLTRCRNTINKSILTKQRPEAG